MAGPQLVNDSKTPSGRAHVGSLRGVLIHDVVARVLGQKGLPVRYTFGVDDYDPLDELPAGQAETFRTHLGKPLCDVPAPKGSRCSDMAEHFIGEFFQVFDALGVTAERYRLRDVYRSGRFNEPMLAIIQHAYQVREVYLRVSGARRPDTWIPVQVICEQCGRIGTTEVVAFDGREVEYHCRPNLVKWATGCGHHGKRSPFDGNAKLPWKMEWAAKWATFGVTIEGAGKDHATKGGSRDVAVATLREVFGKKPPLNIPYEFFLVGGAKMSSSKGVGQSAFEMSELLPPEILRYLMISTFPQRPVNFTPSQELLVKVFNEFDRIHAQSAQSADRQLLMRLCAKDGTNDTHFRPSFQLLLALVQIPSVDIPAEMEKRKGGKLSPPECDILRERLTAARKWLGTYASEEEKFEIQKEAPDLETLSIPQRAYLRAVATELEHVEWEENAIQAVAFDTARLLPIDFAQAFAALYVALLGRPDGPKAGSLISLLDRDFVVARFYSAPPFNRRAFWEAASIDVGEFEAWLQQNSRGVATGRARLLLDVVEQIVSVSERVLDAIGVIELALVDGSGHTSMKRVRFASIRSLKEDASDDGAKRFWGEANDYLKGIAGQYGVQLQCETGVTVFSADLGNSQTNPLN